MAREAPTDASTSSFPPERLVDLGLFAVVVVVGTASAFVGDGSAARELVMVAICLGLVAVRRRRPVATVAVALVLVAAYTLVTGQPTFLLPVSLILIFDAAVRTDRRTTIAIAVAAVATFAVSATVLAGGLLGPELLAAVAWPTLAAAGGEAVRNRRQVVAAAIERAERAERTREDEARRRVAEERLHIARELHDLVAHNMAVVNVQAGIAEHFIPQDPDAAAEALRTVRSSAKVVLDELSGILSVLRAPDDSASTTPMPTLAEIGALVASFDAAGLDITYETSGARRPLSESGELAIYRLVQEALTNAHKHGTGTAVLRMAHETDGLHVTVENPIGAGTPPGPSSGFGLVGMRERITAAGGSVDARSDGRTFVVSALVPYATATGTAAEAPSTQQEIP